MKKLLIIPTVLAMCSLSGVAFAGGSSGLRFTNSLNTSNSSTLKQTISDVKAKSNSQIYNDATVAQGGASIVISGKPFKAKVKDSFNTTNSSDISQSIKNASAKYDSSVYNSATVLQSGASFTTSP
jgi:hypothetical protein